MTWEIFGFGFSAFFLDVVGWIIVTVCCFDDDTYFNPISNYEKWRSMNWFGVWFCTILYWIVFFAPSILVGVVSGLYKIFTIGRR